MEENIILVYDSNSGSIGYKTKEKDFVKISDVMNNDKPLRSHCVKRASSPIAGFIGHS